MEMDAGRLGTICAERDMAFALLRELYPDLTVNQVGVCMCGCPQLHLGHLTHVDAHIFEAKVKAVLSMPVTAPWDEPKPQAEEKAGV